jgi:hypothetical protein
MANVLSLAMKVSADASSVPKQLTPVERALANLGKQAEKATSVLDKFAAGSAAAAAAQAKAAADFDKLSQALANQQITPEEYARQFEALKQSAQDTAAAFAEGARVTEQARTAEERRAAELERLQQLLDLGAINQETYTRAAAEASGANAEAARAEQERAQAAAAAARIIQANLTPQEKYDQQVQELAGHLNAGRLSQEQFDRAVASATASFVKAESAAKGYDKAVEAAGDGGTLKFNELSGVLAALPGPIGNVAGRLSGLSSAGEGLSRVFAGGVSQGIGSVGSSIAALANPATLAIAGFAALGAGAAAVVRGLADLEDRVEKLGNTADKLGVSFGFIQTLEEAANRSGTGIDSVSAAFGRLQKSVTGVDEESKTAQKALSEIGVTAQELQSLNPEEQYRLIGQRLSEIEDPARRTAASINLFGKAGADLLPFFRNLEGASNDLDRFAARLSDLDRGRIDSLGSAFDAVVVSLRGLGQSLLLPFAGLVEGIANAIANVIGSVNRLAQAIGTVLTPVLDGIGAAFTAFGNGLAAVNGWFDSLFGSSTESKAGVADLRGVIEEPLDENFAKEFQKALDGITSSVSKAIDESAKFGDAGFDAALQYQEQIAKLKQQLDAGLFNEETFRREAAKAGDAFKAELARIEEDNKLEIQIEADAQKTLAGLNAEVDKAIKGAAQFGQQGFDAAAQFQSKIDELRRQFNAGIINDEALKQGVEAANAAYDQQIDKIKQIQSEQQKLIEDDRKRVESLLGAQSETAKIEEDILAVQREAARLADEAARAREAGNAAAADGAAARLAQLDQLQAQLDENLQAAEQGFGEAGFGPAFQAINSGLNDAAERASEFGNAGATAFAQLQAGVQAAQEQAKDGILNQEGLDQQIAAQQKAFDQEIKNIEEAAKRREDVQKQVDQMIFDSLDEQQQAQIKAAENIKVLEEEKAAVQAKLAAARDANDKEAIKAGQQRLAQIDKLAAKEQDVASGAAGQREKFLEQQKKVADAQQKQQEAFLQEQQKAAEERQKAEEAEYGRQVERITALNTLGSRTVQTADVRTQEGAAIVLGLAANEQDPQLIQARLTNKVLNRIAASIDRDLNRLGQPALILP